MQVKGTSLRYSKKCMLGIFSFFFFVICSSFQSLHFQENGSGIPSEWQTVRTQIRPHKMWGLILVQTGCQCYQQITLEGLIEAGTNVSHSRLWHVNLLIFFFERSPPCLNFMMEGDIFYIILKKRQYYI